MLIGLIQTATIMDATPKAVANTVKAIKAAKVLGLDIETGFIGVAPLKKDGSVDYETLNPLTGAIRSIQICIPSLSLGGQVPVMQLLGDECEGCEVLDALLEHVQDKSKTTVIHNALYEGEWFLHKYGVLINNAFCTLVAHQIETAGLADCIAGLYGGSANSLATVTERKLGIGITKELQVSDWSKPLTPEQSKYAMLDAYLVVRLYEKFKYLLDTPAARAEMGSLGMFIVLNTRGTPASIQKLKELEADYSRILAKRKSELIKEADSLMTEELRAEIMPKTLSKKKRLEWEFNLKSPQQVKKLLNKLLREAGMAEIEKTDASTLEKLYLPFAQKITEYRTLSKLLEYAEAFVSNYRESDRAVLCKYSVLAYNAAAGRSSASNGSLQIVANTSPLLASENLGGLKTAFLHPRIERDKYGTYNDEEHVAIKCDLPASHLQLVAALTGDELLMYCLSNDEKVHYHTLNRMLQLMGVDSSFQMVKTWFTKPNHGGVTFQRGATHITEAEMQAYYVLAKNVIYSFINFAGAISLNNTFLKKKIHTTVDECRIFLQACKDMYKSVYNFQREIARTAESNVEVLWDEPEHDEECNRLAWLYGAHVSKRGASFLARAVSKIMPDGRKLYFTAKAVIDDSIDVGDDSADEVTWKCRPSNIVAAHWLATEATIMKSVGARLIDAFLARPEWQASVRAFAHDEVVIWVKKSYAPDAAQLYMEFVTEEFRKYVPFFQPESPVVMKNWEHKY
jgi:DNA polymerase I-like protein with 3'-5' exonuclease and polymerase domains